MTSSTALSLRVATAASVFALGSAAALAQDAAPVVVLPDAPAASAPAPAISVPATPTIVLPEPSAPAAAEAPTAASEPVRPRAEAPRAKATAARSTASTQTDRTAQPAPVAAAHIADMPVAEEPTLINPMTVPVAVAPAAEPAPIAATPVDAVADTPSDSDSTGLLAALAGALGLGGLALLMLRRRRREPEVDEVTVLPIATPPAEAVMPRYAVYETRMAPPVETPVAPAPLTASTVVTDGPVPEGDAREDLLNAMVAAAPDASNPFTSHKARRRRARLILQAREQQQSTATPFDWRTYSRPGAGTVDADRFAPVDA